MKNLLIFLSIFITLNSYAGTFDPIEATTARGNHWNLDVSVGYGFSMNGPSTNTFSSKLGVGYMRSFQPIFFTADAFFDLSVGNNGYQALGIKTSLMNQFSGFWGEIGGMRDFSGRNGGTFTIGWSIFGFETKIWSEPNSTTYQQAEGVIKIRLPIGIVHFIKTTPVEGAK